MGKSRQLSDYYWIYESMIPEIQFPFRSGEGPAPGTRFSTTSTIRLWQLGRDESRTITALEPWRTPLPSTFGKRHHPSILVIVMIEMLASRYVNNLQFEMYWPQFPKGTSSIKTPWITRHRRLLWNHFVTRGESIFIRQQILGKLPDKLKRLIEFFGLPFA